MTRYQFIERHRDQFPIQLMCLVLEVSRSGYYAWRTRKPSKRKIADNLFAIALKQIHQENLQTYGYERLWIELQSQGIPCGKHRVRRLMRENGIVVKRMKRYKRTTQPNPDHPVALNLLKQDFFADKPNTKWVGDISYIPTAEGWLYLAVVLDLFSRRVVGWSMNGRMTKQLVMDAFSMAIGQRQPDEGLLFHSDRGSQYTSHDFQSLLATHHTLASMSGRGCCYDNAVAESFFSTLKMESVSHASYQTRAEAEMDIFFYIEGFYNQTRRHSSLGYLSPATFENEVTQMNCVSS